MSARVHVIGIGSPFGDDRFGWDAAQVLRRNAGIGAAVGVVEISVLDRPGALLPQLWRGADTVILLDAVRSGAAPGTWHRLDARALAAAAAPGSSHGFGVAATISLARALGELPPYLWLRGVEADPRWSGSGLSPAVAATFPAFVDDIGREALRLARDPAPVASIRD